MSKKESKKSKIRKIIEKYVSKETHMGTDLFVIKNILEASFDKLEKDLRDLIEWHHVGNNMIQIGHKFYKLTGRKMDLSKFKNEPK